MEEIKLKFKSVRFKLFFTMCVVILVIILSLVLINSIVLENFYIYSKTATIKQVYQKVNDYYNTENTNVDLKTELKKIAYKNNFDILIKTDTNLIIFTSDREFLSSTYILKDINEIKSKSIEENETKINVKVTTDEVNNISYMFLTGILDNGYVLYIRMPISPIEESVKISNTVLLMIGGITLVVAGIIASFISRKFTNPILQLNDIANKMAKLDFSKKYRITDSELKKVTDRVFNNLLNNSVTEFDLNEIQKQLESKAERKTRAIVQQELLNEMGITLDDIQTGNDINAIAYQRTDPIRLNEKVFGYEVGKKINDATINQTKHNTAEKTRWLNQEREDIKKLGIKARSKESAAVQKYVEKVYINEHGEEIPYGDKELAKEFPDVKTQEKIKHASEVFRNKYDTYIDQINNVLTDLGYDAIPKRKDYMRHFTEISDKLSQWGVPFNRNDMDSENLPTDINGLTEFNRPGKNWFASSLERKGMKTTYDAITGIDGYLEGAGNLIFHTSDIQRYRTLSKFIRETYGQTHGLDNVDSLTDAEFEQRVADIQDNKLSKYVAWLDEQANALLVKKVLLIEQQKDF